MNALPRFGAPPPPHTLRTALLEAGGAVVEGAVERSIIDAIATASADWFARTPDGDGDFFGRRTRRFGGVLAKIPQTAALVIAPDILPVIDEFLRQPDGPCGPSRADCIQLNLMQAIAIGPGEAAQHLHRDDALFPVAPEFELMANVMWALDDFTAANGATRLVPGSHRWPRSRTAGESDAVVATMPSGAALIWLGGVIHGGGANATATHRRGLVVSYSLGWLAQAEKLLVSVPPAAARALPPRVQELLGYQIHRPNLGWIEGRDPAEWLRGEIGDTAATRDNLTPAQTEALSAARGQRAAMAASREAAG